jgi:hypothetical protein
MTDGFMPGQDVSVAVGDGQVAGVFVRAGEPSEGVRGESPAADGPYLRDVGLVRRLDTGEVENFLYEHITAR